MTHSYSGVHRSGIISATGLRICWRATAHRQGKNRGARTSTVPNNEDSRRALTPHFEALRALVQQMENEIQKVRAKVPEISTAALAV